MPAKLTHYFLNSATGLLATFATALCLSNLAYSHLTRPHDPLFGIPMNSLFWILGLGAWVITAACVYMRQPRFKLALIMWFAANVIVYRLGLQWQGVHKPSGYLGSLAQIFNLSSGFTYNLLNLLFLYLFTGSCILLLWSFLTRSEANLLKAVCAYCGGHIAFSAQNLGQKIPCPHCQKETALRKSGLLKMSCFFCHGHIEFPSHAIGEKMPCPHCQMDITLKEPA